MFFLYDSTDLSLKLALERFKKAKLAAEGVYGKEVIDLLASHVFSEAQAQALSP